MPWFRFFQSRTCRPVGRLDQKVPELADRKMETGLQDALRVRDLKQCAKFGLHLVLRPLGRNSHLCLVGKQSQVSKTVLMNNILGQHTARLRCPSVISGGHFIASPRLVLLVDVALPE